MIWIALAVFAVVAVAGGVLLLRGRQTAERTRAAAPAEKQHVPLPKNAKPQRRNRARQPSLTVVPRAEAMIEIPQELAWYFRKDTRPSGPHTLERMMTFLEQGRINEDTLVWSEGLTYDWVAVKDVEVFTSLRNTRSQLIQAG